jgi:transcriptional regulator with XRE-family HTH domain
MSGRRALTHAFGQVVRAERLRAKLSQEQLAFRAKIHPTYVSQLERGLKSPTLEVIAALAKALHQRPYALIRVAEDLDG